MIYEVTHQSPTALQFVTHWRARRGRGVLFATSPFVVYLLVVAFLFFLATRDLSLWSRVKLTAGVGVLIANGLAIVCFYFGYRIRDLVDVTPKRIHVVHQRALGPKGATTVQRSDIVALALDPSLRSLGADVLLVAVQKDGARVPIAEGEPHTGQVHELAAKMAQILSTDLEAPKFTAGAAPLQ